VPCPPGARVPILVRHPVGFEQVRISSKPALDKKRLKNRSLLEITKIWIPIHIFSYGKNNLRKERLDWYHEFVRLVLCHGSPQGKPIGIRVYNDLVMNTIELIYCPGTMEWKLEDHTVTDDLLSNPNCIDNLKTGRSGGNKNPKCSKWWENIWSSHRHSYISLIFSSRFID
jgi:hypothetical protein